MSTQSRRAAVGASLRLAWDSDGTPALLGYRHRLAITVLIDGCRPSIAGHGGGALLQHCIRPFLVTFLATPVGGGGLDGLCAGAVTELRGPSGGLSPATVRHSANSLVSQSVPRAALVMLIAIVLAIVRSSRMVHTAGKPLPGRPLHAAGNAVAGGSGFQTGYLRHLYPNNHRRRAHLIASRSSASPS